MIEVKKAWHDEGNFEGFITLRSNAEGGIFVPDVDIRDTIIDDVPATLASLIVFRAAEVIYHVRGDGLRDGASMGRVAEFSKDIDALNSGDGDALEKYVSIQRGRNPTSRYEAIGMGASATFRFGDDASVGAGAGWAPPFSAQFIKEFSLQEVEAPASMLERASV